MALRTPLSATPHLYMGDSTGRPLDMGTVYFGEQDKDPEFYPINLFSNDALTLPLMQPVHTKGGYLYDKGDMVEPHAKEIIYSVKVLDSYGRKVFYKGAMMRNSWNDDVIEQINAAIISSADAARQVATDITNEAINNTAIEGGVLADTFVVVDGSLSQRTINKGLESIAGLSTINNPKDGLRVYVKSYHAGLGKGGGYFVYDSSKESINNGGTIINGWVREYGNYVTPEMFGAYGDGIADDAVALQAALNLEDVDFIANSNTYKTAVTLFNQVPNRTVDFRGAVLGGATNKRYAIITVSTNLQGQSDTALAEALTSLQFDNQIINSHIKNVVVDMMPNTSGGSNLGVGMLGCDGCNISNVKVLNTNGNGIVCQQSQNFVIDNVSIIGARNYGIQLYMVRNVVIKDSNFEGRIARGVSIKHAYYDDRNTNCIVENCTFNKIEFSVSTGGSAASGWGELFHPEGHEITSNVTIKNCLMIGGGRSVDNSCTIRIGYHADNINITDNLFVNSGYCINIGAAGDSGFFVGSTFNIINNTFQDSKVLSNIIASVLPVNIIGNRFIGGEVIRSLYLSKSDLDTSTKSRVVVNNVFEYAAVGGRNSGDGVIELSNAVDTLVEIKNNTINVEAIANIDAPTRQTMTILRVLSTGLYNQVIQDNTIKVTNRGAGISQITAVLCTDALIEGNVVHINNTEDTVNNYGVTTLGNAPFVTHNRLFLNSTAVNAGVYTAINNNGAGEEAMILDNQILGAWSIPTQPIEEEPSV